MEAVKDHLGNVYHDEKEMCEHWGISCIIFRARMRNGWSMEHALSIPVSKAYSKDDRCTDHLGHEYKNKFEMCADWGISVKTYCSRIQKGWTQERALTEELANTSAETGTYTDHLGYVYKNKNEMCVCWGVDVGKYNGKRRKGYTVEQALTCSLHVKDYLGNTFNSLENMLGFYGIKMNDYKRLLSAGEPLDKILLSSGQTKTPGFFQSHQKARRDHQGNVFPSLKEMCRYWGVKPGIYSERINSGWTLEQALTECALTDLPANDTCRDHLGVLYANEKEMCEHWKIPFNSYMYRIKTGWSVERALTTPLQHSPVTKACRDHLGNEFPTMCAMCEHWGISKVVFTSRIRQGWDTERALTEPVLKRRKKSKPCYDHLGNEFRNVMEMCKHYGVMRTSFYERLHEGHSLEEALSSTTRCHDHTGREFKNLGDMYNYWNVSSSIYKKRIAQGWTLEQALTHQTAPVQDHLGSTFKDLYYMLDFYGLRRNDYERLLAEGKPLKEVLLSTGQLENPDFFKAHAYVCRDHQGNVFPTRVEMRRYWGKESKSNKTNSRNVPAKKKHAKNNVCKDHLGNEYPSIKEMCQHYHISYHAYFSRRRLGWPVEKILTGSAQKPRRDHLGNEYPNVTEMCRHYNIEYPTFYGRIRKGYSLGEALTKDMRHSAKDHLGNEFPDVKEMCRHYRITYTVYYSRLTAGWPLEKILMEPINKDRGSKPCRDHLGNEYPSIKEMCQHYHIRDSVYRGRISNGWTLEKALTKSVSRSRNKPYRDHLGNEYPSIKEMCQHYRIRDSVYYNRIRNGWTVEEALTGLRNKVRHGKPCRDHLGNEYPSVKEMCRHYHIHATVYRDRIKGGWTVEEALTGLRDKVRKGKLCRDHLGNEYPSVKEMCRYYHIHASVYYNRIKDGWTVEEALTGLRNKVKKGKLCRDYLGNEYPSVKEMCRHYHIHASAYRDRIKDGWTVEEALTKPVNKKGEPCRDHLGNEYLNAKEMCRHYHISYYTYYSRVRSGWTVERALTESVNKVRNGKPCRDHLGNEYPSVKEMCRHYHIHASVYYNRIKDGWTAEEALTGLRNKVRKGKLCRDHLGNEYPSVKEMCGHYHISYLVYCNRIRNGWMVEKALTEPVNKNKKGNPCRDHLGNEYLNAKEMCRHYHISYYTYYSRVRSGWTVGRALTTKSVNKARKGKLCRDHLGNEYPSVKEMCQHYHINHFVYYGRIRNGWTVEEALTKLVHSQRKGNMTSLQPAN